MSDYVYYKKITIKNTKTNIPFYYKKEIVNIKNYGVCRIIY